VPVEVLVDVEGELAEVVVDEKVDIAVVPLFYFYSYLY